ncbi:DUF5655 domain-containing protein [bacterium]|nr:DUF5655 domain-containing protein [bacterium]
MPLFRLSGDDLTRIKPRYFAKERELQRLFEGNLEELMGIRFVASEFSTGEKHGGRIDTLGLDENDCPVIIEYKLSSKDNVINQGLYYLDWLLDHKGDFGMAVQQRLGAGVKVSWDYSRLILIAQGFNKYDRYAVEQIGRAIELKSYRLYGDSNLYLEDVYSSPLPKTAVAVQATSERVEQSDKAPGSQRTHVVLILSTEDHLEGKPEEVKRLFNDIQEYILGLADNVTEVAYKSFIRYTATRNFCSIRVQSGRLKISLEIPYAELGEAERAIARDMTEVKHGGSGNCELIVNPTDDLEPVFTAIKQSYDYFQ